MNPAQPRPETPQGETETRWRAFAERFLDGFFERHPEAAVAAGRHEHDGRLSDWSRDALRERVDWLRSERERARGFPEAALSPASRFERSYLLTEIEARLFWLSEAEWPFRSPSFYADALDPEVYVARPYAPPSERLEALVAYARRVPRAAEQIRANLRSPMPPAYAGFGAATFGGLAEFFERDAGRAFGAAADEAPAAGNALAEAAGRAGEALRSLADWCDRQGTAAADGASFRLGADGFRRMLRATEGLEVEVGTLERLGERELERNLEELGEACSRLLPGAGPAECVARVRARKPPDGPVAEARRQLRRLRRFVAERGLVTIPEHPEVRVEESPPYMRWNSAYIHIPGPDDADLPSTYYISPPDPAWTAEERTAYLPGRADLLFASVHEVWPGHFLHFTHAHRAESPVARNFIGYAFVEGWAHYAEELMGEVGLEADDPEVEVARVMNALVRTVRYLVAIGLHAGSLDVAEAERLFREKAFMDPAGARQQAARGTFDPGYLAYTLGKVLIRRLREEWRSERGPDLRPFHDELLSLGAPPLPLAREALLGPRAEPPL